MPAWLQPIRIPRSPFTSRPWLPRVIGRGGLAFALLCSFVAPARAATPAGTIIANQAEALLTTHSGVRRSFPSNIDRFEVLMPAPPPSTAKTGFYRFDPAGDAEGGSMPARYLDPAGVFQPVPNVPASLLERAPSSAHFSRADTFHAGELIQLRVFDRDQNFYVTDVETITVRVASESGEMEILELTETGKDTGIFTGFVSITQATAAATQDGRITARPNTHLSLSYVDPNDAADRTEADILVDPYGLIFDSSTGEPVSGVPITIVDDATGLPAEVFGVDGVSRYPSTVVTGDTVRDASGATYELEAGSYVFPFVRPGRYRYTLKLDGKAGFTFPSTATPDQLASTPGGPYSLGAASTGGTFDVVLVPVKVDIPLDAAETALALSMSTPTSSAGTGDFVRYDLELTSRRTLLPFRNVVLHNRLPAGFRLEEKSLRVDGVPGSIQFPPDGRSFTLGVAELAGGQTVRISYLARVVTARHGRAVNAAYASAGRIRSSEASASVFVQDDLMATRAHLLGRVVRWENGRPSGDGIPGVAVYIETGTMVVTDARGFFHFEGLHPGTHVVQLDTTTLPDGARAVLPEGSTENAGRAWSRFADVSAGSLWTADFYVETAAAAPADAPAVATPARTTTTHDQDWIDGETDTFEWLLPNAATPLPTPAVKILVKHHPGHRVRALLNGEPVNPINFEGTLRSNRRPVAASLWRGVMLREGGNTLEIVREDSFGIERGRETRVVHYASPPVRAELITASSTLVADGLTVPTMAVRLYDRRDKPARAGITGRYFVHAPFAAWQEEKTDIRLTPGAVAPPTLFTVGEDGIALIKLQPVTESGTVRLSLDLAEGTQELRADLHGSREDWLVVGVAEGTPAWNTISGHLENATADDVEKGFDQDGRVAFFAKGRIKGGWLLTAAYDSAKEKPLPSQRLHGLIDPDAYYTVYGDDSQRYENAPSSRKLYVKLERKAVVALFGDYSLDWSSSAFATYTRELHGAKVEYRGEKLRASAFQSDAGLTHGRDEFRGSGLSGPYVLTRRPLVAFSERVILQERDRMRPDIVLLETPLARNVDYAIDYTGGVVRLSQPLFPSSSSELNPQYLVVHYEMEDQTAGTVEGARVEYAPHDRIAVGASHVRQSQDGRTDSVSALDARAQLTKQLQLTAEVARSDNASGTSDAYRAELAHATEKTQTRVYYREVGGGFGLDQLSESQLGNRQIGIEGSQQLTTTLAARELLYQETVLPSGDRRHAGEAQLEWTRGHWSFRSGLRSAQDTREGVTQASHLLTAGVSRRFLDERLELRADREQSIAGEAENLDFPTRTVLGARYAVTAKTALIAEQEWTEARDRRTTVSRLGAKTTPWKGGALTGSVAQSFGAFPSTSLGSGLNQVIELTPRLSVEGGLERSTVLSDAEGEGDGGGASAGGFSSSPFHGTSGFSSAAQGESTSVFAGVHWKPRNVLYNARVEFNDMQGSQRTGLLASAQSEAGRNLGLMASVIASEQTASRGDSSFLLDARLGAAWRPSEGSTIVLQRLDFVHIPGAGASSTASGWKIIENLHVNRRLGSRWQISAHVGAKYVLAGLGGYSAESLTTLGALEARVNLTPKWDLGFNAAALSGWGLDTHQWSTGVSIGRTVATNLWVSVGYNARGFVDTDFTAARYTAPGVYLRFRLKFDQESLAGLLNVIKAE